ncbi:amino acid ABC transporter permease [Halomonas sp. NPDC076908]|uniref:amino acid ABC transporter permease n=1 Tax=Halomonas sp. NPDC076908 TaxID=3390567 RepID=UPI003D0379B6
MTALRKTELANLTKEKRIPWAQWATALIAVSSLAFLIISFAQGNINWGTVGRYLFDKGILLGLINTIWMTFAAMFLTIVLGTILAIMKIAPNGVLKSISGFYIWLFRGIPQLLQLFLWYNLALVFPYIGIPGVLGVETSSLMTPVLATVLGLGLCQAAYTAEVVRAGVLSVDDGQVEAASSIGMRYGQQLYRVILPQAMRVIIPPVGNYFITMVKLTSLASAIQFSEILYNAQTIYYVNGQVMELLFVATFWYLIVITVLTLIQARIETYFSKGYTRESKPRNGSN